MEQVQTDFTIERRQLEFYQDNNGVFEVASDGSLTIINIKRIELHFKCQLLSVMPYTKLSGANWICLRFFKNEFLNVQP